MNAAEHSAHPVSPYPRGERPDVWDVKRQCACSGRSHALRSWDRCARWRLARPICANSRQFHTPYLFSGWTASRHPPWLLRPQGVSRHSAGTPQRPCGVYVTYLLIPPSRLSSEIKYEHKVHDKESEYINLERFCGTCRKA